MRSEKLSLSLYSPPPEKGAKGPGDSNQRRLKHLSRFFKGANRGASRGPVLVLGARYGVQNRFFRGLVWATFTACSCFSARLCATNFLSIQSYIALFVKWSDNPSGPNKAHGETCDG